MNPDKAKNLLIKFRLPKHIIAHINKVTHVAETICDAYLIKGYKLDKNAVVCGSLLHDLMRVIDITGGAYAELCNHSKKEDIKMWDKLKKKYQNTDHSVAGCKYLNSKGERKIALIVKKHKFDAVIDPVCYPKSLEEKITTYADKRVLHNKIVSLKERFQDGEIRYNPKHENMEIQTKIQKRYFILEKELFENIDLKPCDIK